MTADLDGGALKFITCGSVDDGKSTLIGRLLLDSKAVLADQLAGVQRDGEPDLALFTDGLIAEREQGITIDVAYRYFSTASRKFIIGDAPGHEQYTRNMVTAASGADAAVVLVDVTKIDWQSAMPGLLPQTRRHALLVKLLRVPSLIFAVNKLDAVADPETAWRNVRAALTALAAKAALAVTAIVPISALKGWNVVDSRPGWCAYEGPGLLSILEGLPRVSHERSLGLSMPVQWVEKSSVSSAGGRARRVFWGRLATGAMSTGMSLKVFPGEQIAKVEQLLGPTRERLEHADAGSVGVVFDREIDVSRGDWLFALEDAPVAQRSLEATIAWLDDEALVEGRMYWALHGHRWVKARVRRVIHRLDVNTLEASPASSLAPNEIGRVSLEFQQALATRPFEMSRALGSMILVDTGSHRTSAAVLVS